MNEEARREILDDEWLIVRNSGEIPEITFHSVLYFLSEETDGPGMHLREEEILTLKHAAAARFQEIILRDILLENYHKTIYRGIRRSIYNLERYQNFCRRQEMNWKVFQQQVAEQLLVFLEQGMAVAGNELPARFLNCTFMQLVRFAEDCGLTSEQLPDDVLLFCRQG